MGRLEEALQASREAHTMMQGEILPVNPSDESMNALAASILSNLSILCTRLDRAEEGITAGREGLAILYRIYQVNPTQHSGSVTKALSNLGGMLNANDQTEEAISMLAESVDLQRGLVARRPDLFRPGFATVLQNYAAALSAASRNDFADEEMNDRDRQVLAIRAVEASKEAVASRRELFLTRPVAMQDGLAKALFALALHQGFAEQWEGAIASGSEAVSHFDALLAATTSSTLNQEYKSSLGIALQRQSFHQHNAGCTEEALVTGGRALDLHHEEHRADPEGRTDTLEETLWLMESYATASGRMEDAAAYRQELENYAGGDDQGSVDGSDREMDTD